MHGLCMRRRSPAGSRIKFLTVADDFGHECVDISVDFGMGGANVTRLKDRAATFSGNPREVRIDNGQEFTFRAFMTWKQKHGIEHILIESGTITQNVYRKLQLNVPR